MAANDRPSDDWRTAREIATAPEHPDADAIRWCEDHRAWTPHRMDDSGAYDCLRCVEEADDQDVREAVEEHEQP